MSEEHLITFDKNHYEPHSSPGIRKNFIAWGRTEIENIHGGIESDIDRPPTNERIHNHTAPEKKKEKISPLL